MRIRSIKYRSNNNNERENQAPYQNQLYSRGHLLTQSTHHQSNPSKIRQMFTEQCFNIKQDEQIDQINFDAKNRQKGTLEDNYAGIQSEKLNTRGSSMYLGNKRLDLLSKDKENRTSILQQKNNVIYRNEHCNSVAGNQNGFKKQKMKLKLSKFSSNFQKELQNIRIGKNENKPDQCQRKLDQIILGQNLTYNIQELEDSLAKIEQEKIVQKSKIDKIRKQLNLIGPKIQRQLDNIVKDFRKHLQGLNQQLTKGKSEKCTILVNWRSVISQKNNQYQQQGQMIWNLHGYLDGIQNEIQGKQQAKREISFIQNPAFSLD